MDKESFLIYSGVCLSHILDPDCDTTSKMFPGLFMDGDKHPLWETRTVQATLTT